MGSFKDQTVEGKMSPQIYGILVNNLISKYMIFQQ